MAGKRTRENRILSSITRALERNSFQRNPYLPNLINQPDLLVVPSPGRLIALYIYDFPERITWRLALGAIEDIFELKTAVGPDVRAIALLIAGPDHETAEGTGRSEMLRLISNSFDLAEDFSSQQPDVSFSLERLRAVQPQARLADLWKAEAQFQGDALRRHYRESELRSLIDVNRRPSEQAKQSFRDDVRERIRGNNRHIEPNFLVRNAKGGLGHLDRSYCFEFDLRVDTQPPTLIDFLKSNRFGMREKLRYYLAKARLIRYWIDQSGVHQLTPDYALLLVVDGNIAGPDHDPFRYVRMLVSVGWRIAQRDEYERIERLAANADL
jgi:hypothetical protein